MIINYELAKIIQSTHDEEEIFYSFKKSYFTESQINIRIKIFNLNLAGTPHL